METLTIHEAAATTGWSARMLRYIERTGLLTSPRTASGYRVYGPGELQRLRTLKELLRRFGTQRLENRQARLVSFPPPREAPVNPPHADWNMTAHWLT